MSHTKESHGARGRTSLGALSWAYLLVAGTAGSLLAPEGDGKEPLGFFGNTVPLLTVVLRGRVCARGLAARQAEKSIRTLPLAKADVATVRKETDASLKRVQDTGSSRRESFLLNQPCGLVGEATACHTRIPCWKSPGPRCTSSS